MLLSTGNVPGGLTKRRTYSLPAISERNGHQKENKWLFQTKSQILNVAHNLSPIDSLHLSLIYLVVFAGATYVVWKINIQLGAPRKQTPLHYENKMRE